jgi:beta-lactamase class D
MKLKGIVLIGLAICTGCVRNNIKEKNLYKKIFDKYQVTGSFAAYDNGFNEFSIYNLKRYRDSAFSPASTFKIINSLIGLETGNIIENDVKKWDGVKRSIDAWNKDHNFESAFRNSVVWYFQDVARKIGRDTMKMYLDSIAYGNKNISGAMDSFWLNNTILVTADEQLGIVKKLYFNKLNSMFSERSYTKVKNAMLMESKDKFSISYKTGLTVGKNGLPLSWIIGWVEKKGSSPKVNFFVLNTEGKMSMEQMISVRKPMLMELLKEEKIIEN